MVRARTPRFADSRGHFADRSVTTLSGSTEHRPTDVMALTQICRFRARVRRRSVRDWVLFCARTARVS